jgi:hypothetical protein
MTGRDASRLTALGLAAVAGIGLWQALKLDRWGFDGPDAGFFPQVMAGVCVVLALVVAAWPGRPNEGDDGEADAGDEGRVVTRRSFAVYALALGVMAAGAMGVGFAPTALLTTVLVMRFAEGRGWRASLGYGVAMVAVCMVLFGWLLRVALPAGPFERYFYSLVR